MVAAVDTQFNSTIRHVQCEILISDEGRCQRCVICEKYRKSLHSMVCEGSYGYYASNSGACPVNTSPFSFMCSISHSSSSCNFVNQ